MCHQLWLMVQTQFGFHGFMQLVHEHHFYVGDMSYACGTWKLIGLWVHVGFEWMLSKQSVGLSDLFNFVDIFQLPNAQVG